MHTTLSAERPETIEHRWDVLYRDYPDVYDEFASYPYTPQPVDVVADRFDLAGKTIVEVGSGSGLATARLAKRAQAVIALEREAAMLALAHRRLSHASVGNVSLVGATAEALPLRDACADAVLAVTSPLDLAEGLRVVRPGGHVVRIDIPPGWYGGDLNSIIAHATPGLDEGERRLLEAGFGYFDLDSVQEYGSTENILRSFGFIFGRRAIDHLRRTGLTSVRWKFRIYHQRAR